MRAEFRQKKLEICSEDHSNNQSYIRRPTPSPRGIASIGRAETNPVQAAASVIADEHGVVSETYVDGYAMKRSWDHVTEMRDVGVMLTSPYVSDLHSSTCSEGAFG